MLVQTCVGLWHLEKGFLTLLRVWSKASEICAQPFCLSYKFCSFFARASSLGCQWYSALHGVSYVSSSRVVACACYIKPGRAHTLTDWSLSQVQPGTIQAKLRLKQLCGLAMAWELCLRSNTHLSKLCIKCVTKCTALTQLSGHNGCRDRLCTLFLKNRTYHEYGVPCMCMAGQIIAQSFSG